MWEHDIVARSVNQSASGRMPAESDDSGLWQTTTTSKVRDDLRETQWSFSNSWNACLLDRLSCWVDIGVEGT